MSLFLVLWVFWEFRFQEKNPRVLYMPEGNPPIFVYIWKKKREAIRDMEVPILLGSYKVQEHPWVHGLQRASLGTPPETNHTYKNLSYNYLFSP
jgi:hypothetical protein